MTHRHITDMQRGRLEGDRRYLLRKTTDAAENRMRERTAKEQHAAMLRELYAAQDEMIPDADDSSIRGVLR